MKVKISKKIVYILLLLILCSVVYFLFKIEMSNEVVEKEKVGYVAENTILPTPDRIVYKSTDNGYIVIDSEQVEYSKIYSELYNRVTDVVDGKVYSEDEIREMQDRGSFIELDYDVKSMRLG